MANGSSTQNTFSFVAEFAKRYPSHLHSAFGRFVAALITPLNHFFDRLYHSRFNPLYRSGAIAVGLLLAATISGVYLLFFYKLSAPYESLERISTEVFLGSWMRSFHRYTTDAAMLAILVHIIQLVAQGRTWGPRILAWISGVILLLAVLVSAWTGYVMIWDVHGQELATAGASLLESIPILQDVITSAFDGSSKLPPSFFFMNMFLHVAVPLGIVLVLWVHTCRLTGNMWFPFRHILFWTITALLVLSFLWPAPLPPGADLLKIPGEMPLDIFYSFWLPFVDWFGAYWSLLFWILLFCFLLSIPFWCKPRGANVRHPSHVVEEDCIGCNQCALDCPFEAITMMNRQNVQHRIAEVDPALCVSCGVCGSSCPTYAVGPPGRTGHQLEQRAEQFLRSIPKRVDGEQKIVLVACTRNPAVLAAAEDLCTRHSSVHSVYPVACSGTIHTRELEKLAESFDGIFVWNCPTRNCVNRRGGQLLLERIYQRRQPFLSRSVNPERIHIHPASAAERKEIERTLSSFEKRLAGNSKDTVDRKVSDLNPQFVLKRVIASIGLLLLLGAATRVPYGTEAEHGLLRVSVRLPGEGQFNCRDITASNSAAALSHMQRQQTCDTLSLNYRTILTIDGTQVIDKMKGRSGLQGDRPILIFEEHPLSPGTHTIAVTIDGVDEKGEKLSSLSFSQPVQIEKKNVALISNSSERYQLELISRSATP